MADTTKVVTGKSRLSYVNVFSPRVQEQSGEERYSLTVLIPKEDTASMTKIKQAIEAAKARYVERNGAGKLPKQLKSIIHDGDGERPNGGEFGPECAGCWVMTISCKEKPVIVDAQRNEITDAGEVYSGCYGRVSMTWYVYDTNGNRGISAQLLAVQKLHDGEPLGGSRGSADDFDDDYRDADMDDIDAFLGA